MASPSARRLPAPLSDAVTNSAVQPTSPQTPQGYKGLAAFHKYWGKKPTEAWRLLIERLTAPGDIVLDPFLGSGLIARECTDLARRFVGFDINPLSLALTELYLAPPAVADLQMALTGLYRTISGPVDDLYRVSTGAVATHLLWQGDAIVKAWTKRGRSRVELALDPAELAALASVPPYTPQSPFDFRFFDNPRINARRDMTISELFSPRALAVIDLLAAEIAKLSGRTQAALRLILSASLGQMSNMVFAVSPRGKPRGATSPAVEVGSWVIGYWRPNQHFEVHALNCFDNKAARLLKALAALGPTPARDVASTSQKFFAGGAEAHLALGDSETLLRSLPTASVHVVLTDPPHGDRIPYLELSEMWNGFLGFTSDLAGELVISDARARGKDPAAYNCKLAAILQECTRVLRPDGVLAIMFNARLAPHWQGLQRLAAGGALTYVGCYPLAYSAGSVVQDSRAGALKADYVLLYAKDATSTRCAAIAAEFAHLTAWSSTLPPALTT